MMTMRMMVSDSIVLSLLTCLFFFVCGMAQENLKEEGKKETNLPINSNLIFGFNDNSVVVEILPESSRYNLVFQTRC